MGFFYMVERCYEGRRALTLLTLVLNLCFGMAFSITTFNVVGRCVTEPCVAETAGLLRINSGTSFGLLLTGFLFILQPVYGLWFFRVKCSDVVGGAFVGATVMLSLQAMMTSSQWSYVAKGVATMDPIVARAPAPTRPAPLRPPPPPARRSRWRSPSRAGPPASSSRGTRPSSPPSKPSPPSRGSCARSSL